MMHKKLTLNKPYSKQVLAVAFLVLSAMFFHSIFFNHHHPEPTTKHHHTLFEEVSALFHGEDKKYLFHSPLVDLANNFLTIVNSFSIFNLIFILLILLPLTFGQKFIYKLFHFFSLVIKQGRLQPKLCA